MPILNGAVISFQCKVDEEEVGITELDYFDNGTASDQDFHPIDALSITTAPARDQAQGDDKSIRPIKTNSSSGSSSRKKIRDYHFNTRTSPDTPPEQRPKPGSLPGLLSQTRAILLVRLNAFSVQDIAIRRW